jgi:hypothetical protein
MKRASDVLDLVAAAIDEIDDLAALHVLVDGI